MRFSKIDQKRRPSADTNKENTNSNNVSGLNYLSNHVSFKPNFDYK